MSPVLDATTVLDQRLLAPGFTPRREDLPALLALLLHPSRKQALAAERALVMLGPLAAQEALARLPEAQPPLRALLCRLVGRLAMKMHEERLAFFLRERLADSDVKTRRNAIIALGKLPYPWIEDRLLQEWSGDLPLAHRRSLAEALGKVGGPAALDTLRNFARQPAVDAELTRILSEAMLKIERTAARQQIASLDPARTPRQPLEVAFTCRPGLETILHEEIDSALAPRIAGRGRVVGIHAGPLTTLYSPRTMLRFGFPLTVPAPATEDDLAQVVSCALTSPAALELFHTWTRGPIRFRLEWAKAGHRRGLTWRCVEKIAARCPELINDPQNSTWEVIVQQGKGQIYLEIWPRSLADPRFVYRRRDLPASSHPTMAAALARVSGVRPDDVVWDPFAGSGTELIERGLLGPYARLIGSDLSAEALQAAQENLKAASLARWFIHRGDARHYTPSVPVTLIVTNPPMGRRVLKRDAIIPLFEQCLPRFAACLTDDGRLAWISPLFEATVRLARQAGLKPTFRQKVDMGGFSAELQVFRKRKTKAVRG